MPGLRASLSPAEEIALTATRLTKLGGRTGGYAATTTTYSRYGTPIVTRHWLDRQRAACAAFYQQVTPPNGANSNA